MIRIILIIFAVSLAQLRASEPPPSLESIREFFALTDVRKMVDGMFSQIEGMMMPAMQQAVGRALTPEEQKFANSFISKTMAQMRDEMSWDRMEALYIRVYQKSLTQSEVDGMIAFYKSPAGIALIKKMPAIMQESMIAMQERMGPMMQNIQKSLQEAALEMRQKN